MRHRTPVRTTARRAAEILKCLHGKAISSPENEREFNEQPRNETGKSGFFDVFTLGRRGARDRRNGPGVMLMPANATSEASGEKTRATPQSATDRLRSAQVVKPGQEIEPLPEQF